MTTDQKLAASYDLAVKLPEDEMKYIKVDGNYYLLSRAGYINVLQRIARDLRDQRNEDTDQTLHHDPVADSI
jgi:hypothetical protein